MVLSAHTLILRRYSWLILRKKILVVDDEASQRELLGSFVESLGFQVEQAGSAEEALQLVNKQPPQMVLLDVRLPGISGIEAPRQIASAGGAAAYLADHGPRRSASGGRSHEGWGR